MALFDPITDIVGLGEQSARKLAKFGIKKQVDLLFHLPIRYQDKTKITQIDALIIGQTALVEGVIKQVEKHTHPRKQLHCEIDDGSKQTLTLRFFHWFESQTQYLRRGQTIQCYGEINYHHNHLEIIHPEYRVTTLKQTLLLSDKLSPIYANTSGIAPYKLKKWIQFSLTQLQDNPLPDVIAKCQSGLPDINQAIQILHYPNLDDLDAINTHQHLAQKRLALDEFSANQLALQYAKQRQKSHQSTQFTPNEDLNQQLTKQLDFKLTQAQQNAVQQIQTDLAKSSPMLRLVQGDVGCGKTIVAVFASLSVVINKTQVALMVPTEILAKQHLISFEKYLAPFGVICVLLTGRQNQKIYQKNLSLCQNGKAQIVIGTHALFQEAVVFHHLGLVIIDEQHKFGVQQRLLLSQKSTTIPHQLIMTATPIPRSLMMSLYADLDSTIINELPPNRLAIKTIAVSQAKQIEIMQKIKQVCAKKTANLLGLCFNR